MTENSHEHANVIAPPPLIYGVSLLVGLLLQWASPRPLLARTTGRVVGLTFIITGFLTGLTAALTMRRANTSLRPDTPTTAIVDTGPFRYTRNPIYLGFTLMYTGVACFANALWPIVILPFVLAVMQRGVIEREEQYLTRKFGLLYTQYQTRVRRWL
ncbi:MAG: isoprenylcysteine carboxylmethyltransferase family protein [Chloroflexi bacterium]|nr:isoprenylcysteine carboxylmethyltransferase family protein [Chloroflexota bacterium]